MKLKRNPSTTTSAPEQSSPVQRKIFELKHKFNAKTASPWDGKRETLKIATHLILICNTVPKGEVEADACLLVRHLDIVMKRDAFAFDVLVKDGLLQVVDPSAVLPKGEYRPLGGRPKIFYPSGIISLDVALNGGFIGSYMQRIWGASQSGKSLILYMVMIRAWEIYHKPSLLIAGEFAFDEERFCSLVGGREMYEAGGVKIFEPGVGEEALDEGYDKIGQNIFAVVGVDSVNSLKPEEELKKSLSKSARVGAKAAMQTRFIERVLPVLHKTNTALIVIIHNKPDTKESFGTHDPIAGTYNMEGGKQGAAVAFEYYSTQSIRMNAPRALRRNKEGELLGHKASGVVDKQRFSPRGRTFEFNIDYYEGIDDREGLVNMAIQQGVIQLRGRRHQFGDHDFENSGALQEALVDRDLYWNLYHMVYEKFKGEHP